MPLWIQGGTTDTKPKPKNANQLAGAVRRGADIMLGIDRLFDIMD